MEHSNESISRAPITTNELDDINIDPKIISDIDNIINKLLILTDDDVELVSTIVEYSFLLCKDQGIYMEDINDLIWKKYPNIHTDTELEGKEELFRLIYDLTRIILVKHKTLIEDLETKPYEERERFKELMRIKIEEEIINTYFLSDSDSEQEICDIIYNPIEEN